MVANIKFELLIHIPLTFCREYDTQLEFPNAHITSPKRAKRAIDCLCFFEVRREQPASGPAAQIRPISMRLSTPVRVLASLAVAPHQT